MASSTGPDVITDGLVLALDGADITSFRGEPTTNLLYDNGVINWTISNLTINVSRSTVITNSKYRITSTTFINPYTVGAFRLLIPLSKLTNGVTYTMSFKWKIISGESTFYMTDWNDTSLFNVVTINYDNYNYSTATGVRATYDNTYRFMDFIISENTVVEIWDVQLEAKSYATPFVIGTRGVTVATGGGWADLSGNTNHGELVNGVRYDSGNGGSLTFDGVGGYINLPNDLGYTTQVSAFCVFKGTGTPVGNYHILFGGQELEISIPTSGQIRTGIYTNSRYVSNHGSGLLDGNYHVVGFTFDGSTKTSYIDGQSVGTQSVSGVLTSVFSNRRMGRFGSSTGYYANGHLAHTSIYNRALTAEEISQNFNATRGRFGI